MINSIEREFLIESNAIEEVYDADSLAQAVLAWEYLKRQKKLDIGAILKAHKILMLHQPDLQPNQKGYFRQIRVWVGGREGLEWRKINKAMESWVKISSNINNTTHSIPDVIKTEHIGFEKIHPFVDGNGRIGRMLLNWQRIMAALPILILRHDEREDYYRWFK